MPSMTIRYTRLDLQTSALKKRKKKDLNYFISGAGGDSSRSSIGGYFHSGSGGSLSRWEPYSDGWSGAEKGESSDILESGTSKWLKQSNGNQLWCLYSCIKQEEASSLSIFSGEEERFAFQRTVSRLTQMQTEEYWTEGDRSAKSQA